MNYVNAEGKRQLLSIKEFSQLCGIEQTTLRYWDDIGLFSPAVHNAANGYRLYAPDQMISINFIKLLSSFNIPLKVIARIGKNRSPETMLQLIEQHELVLDTELERLHRIYSTIHTLRALIKEGLDADSGALTVRDMAPLPIIMGPPNAFKEERTFHRTFMRYCKQAKENFVDLNNPIGGCFDSMERFLESDSTPSRFFSVDPKGRETRPGGRCLVGYTRGYYGQMGNLPQRMSTFAAENKLALAGPVYVLYLHNEICMEKHDDYLAQVCVTVRDL